MSTNKECQNRREAIAALVLGELEPQAADEIKKHIEACQTCQPLYQAMAGEEETIRLAFRTIADRSETIQDSLIEQTDKPSYQSLLHSAAPHIHTQSRETRIITFIRRTIMKSRITKLAAAAVIIIAVFLVLHFAGGPDMASIAWGELVERVEQSHNEYYTELLLAMEAKDVDKVSARADALSEFWQGLNMLAEAKLDPTIQFQSEDSLKLIREKTFYDHFDEQRMQQIFRAYASEFIGWLNKIEDAAWINEIIHVCKQLEEYAEEIREPGRHPEIEFSYAEHCLPSFIAYCEWFELLPWDNPEQGMTPVTLLSGIQRDLEVARRELEALQIRGFDRYIIRCLQQAQKNVMDLEIKISLSTTKKQWDFCRQLNRMIDELSGLIAYATIASGDIRQNNEFHDPEAVHRVFTEPFDNKASFADYFIERIDQSLNLCEQLLQELESDQ